MCFNCKIRTVFSAENKAVFTIDFRKLKAFFFTKLPKLFYKISPFFYCSCIDASKQYYKRKRNYVDEKFILSYKYPDIRKNKGHHYNDKEYFQDKHSYVFKKDEENLFCDYRPSCYVPFSAHGSFAKNTYCKEKHEMDKTEGGGEIAGKGAKRGFYGQFE